MVILEMVLSSAVLVAFISFVLGPIVKSRLANNKRDEKIKLLSQENEDLKNQLKELQQTVSEQAATITELRDQQAQYNTNQQDSGYSDYISWET